MRDMWHIAHELVDRRGDVLERLLGEAKVLDLADRMRRSGGATPHRLYHESVEAFRRGELSFDRVSQVYRHAAIHAGVIVPRDRPRLHTCPECGAKLDVAVER